MGGILAGVGTAGAIGLAAALIKVGAAGIVSALAGLVGAAAAAVVAFAVIPVVSVALIAIGTFLFFGKPAIKKKVERKKKLTRTINKIN